MPYARKKRRRRHAPAQFETLVLDYLTARRRPVSLYKVLHNAKVKCAEGEYQIDLIYKFRFAGVDYFTLVECKTNGRPIERAVVQILADKVRSLGVHKGVLFATEGFQRSAIEYAEARGIGLVHVRPDGFVAEVTGKGVGEYRFVRRGVVEG